jgi:hypothetical protein
MFPLFQHICAVGLAILLPAWASGQEDLQRTFKDEQSKIRGTKSVKVVAMGKKPDSKPHVVKFECRSDDQGVLAEIKSFLEAVSPNQYSVKVPGSLASAQWVYLQFFSNRDFTGEQVNVGVDFGGIRSSTIRGDFNPAVRSYSEELMKLIYVTQRSKWRFDSDETFK